MSENMVLENLQKSILHNRKELGLTQEQLADKLGISYQAVSKWETGIACPDIMMLPKISEIFSVTIDALFGLNLDVSGDKPPLVEATKDIMDIDDTTYINKLPWENDRTIRGVIYKGHKLLKIEKPEEYKFTFVYDGEALNVKSRLSIECEHVQGDVMAGDSISCGDVGGSVNAGDALTCNNIGGNVNVGDSMTSNNINGDVHAGDGISCNNIAGNVTAGDSISCQNIVGNVDASDQINASEISGNVNSGDSIKCDIIYGDVHANDSVRCNEIHGRATANDQVVIKNE